MKSTKARATTARMGHAVAVAVAVAATLLLCTTMASAFFPARYVACEQDEARPRAAPAPVKKRPTKLIDLPRRRAPAALKISPLVVIDVATVEPIPARPTSPISPEASRGAAQIAVLREGRNDYRCIGVPRGKAGILRVVAAPPGSRFYGHTSGDSWRRDNMRAAGMFALRGATAGLRRELARSLPAGIDDHRLVDHLHNKVTAARALAHLGDSQSAGSLRAFLRAREPLPYSGMWEDGVEALGLLDARVAQLYAVAALKRVANAPKLGTHERNILRTALPLLTTPSPKALAPLRKLSARLVDRDGDPDGHDACLVLGARARLGDQPLLAELRPELDDDIRTQRGAACYSQLIGPTFPGRDPDEVDALTHRHRYHEIIGLLERMRRAEASGQSDPRFATARTKLRSWLNKRSSAPNVRGDPSHRAHSPITRARHLTALAYLGDARAKADLDALIVDPTEEGAAPWVALRYALRLDLDGAADMAAKRLRMAIKSATVRRSTEPWAHRGFLTVTEHVQVIDALAERGDARFALGLLDRNIFARMGTVAQLARRRPKAACRIVATAARDAGLEQIQDAFWALSVLGSACRDRMRRLASDGGQPKEVRGMAIEALAMMRDDSVPGHLKREAARTMGGALRRARIIFTTKP